MNNARDAIRLMTFGSAIRKPWIGIVIGLGLSAFIGLGVTGFAGIFSQAKPDTLKVAYEALLAGAIISAVPISILRWLDRQEPEPWFIYLLAFLWGGVIATGIAVPINEVANLFTVPFIEEFAKAIGLLALIFVFRPVFDGPRDGFVLGALIGLGFNWLEFAEYTANSFAMDGSAEWAQQIASRYALFGINGHVLYTGIAGTFLGFALLHRSWGARISLAIAGYLLASVSHFIWDTIGVFTYVAIRGGMETLLFGEQAVSQASSSLPLWFWWLLSTVQVLVVNLLPLIVIVIGLRRSGLWERRIMAEELKQDVGTKVITADEYANISGRCALPKAGIARRIFQLQCAFAKRRSHLRRNLLAESGDPIQEANLGKIEKLRVRVSAPGVNPS